MVVSVALCSRIASSMLMSMGWNVKRNRQMRREADGKSCEEQGISRERYDKKERCQEEELFRQRDVKR